MPLSPAPDSQVSGFPHPRPRRDQEITGWRIQLYYWTRHPQILIWTAAILIGAGIAIGYLVQPQKDARRTGALMEDATKELQEDADDEPRVSLGLELSKPQPEPKRVFIALRQRDRTDANATQVVTAALQAAQLDPGMKSVALAYWMALNSGLNEPGADLLYLAHQVNAPPYANELTAEMMGYSPKKSAKALKYLERELAIRPDAKEARKRIVALHWGNEDFAALDKLQQDAQYTEFFTPEVRLELAMRNKQWAKIWEPLIEVQKSSFSHRIPLVLTLVAGAVWVVLAWQMMQVPGLFSFRIWAPLFAIPLGALSTLPVLFLDAYQSEAWGLKHTGLFLEDTIFFVAGVGLREELCKFLLFLPLAPILLRRGNRLEMVVIAGCVGLGFAMEENVSYFRMSNPSLAFARFLTANFFHFAATGLIGLAFCDTLRNFRQRWWRFPVVFVTVAAAHGFYDAFLSATTFFSASLGLTLYIFLFFKALGFSCFILLSMAFFRTVARERGPATDTIFPATTLIVGLAVLVATIIVCASLEYGMEFALGAITASAIILGFFVYMFYVLFRDGLVEEQTVMPNYEPL